MAGGDSDYGAGGGGQRPHHGPDAGTTGFVVGAPRRSVQKLFGGRSVTCDFVDLAQKGFFTPPVAPLQGSFGPPFAASPTVSRLNINPPNSFSLGREKAPAKAAPRRGSRPPPRPHSDHRPSPRLGDVRRERNQSRRRSHAPDGRFSLRSSMACRAASASSNAPTTTRYRGP